MLVRSYQQQSAAALLRGGEYLGEIAEVLVKWDATAHLLAASPNDMMS